MVDEALAQLVVGVAALMPQRMTGRCWAEASSGRARNIISDGHQVAVGRRSLDHVALRLGGRASIVIKQLVALARWVERTSFPCRCGSSPARKGRKRTGRSGTWLQIAAPVHQPADDPRHRRSLSVGVVERWEEYFLAAGDELFPWEVGPPVGAECFPPRCRGTWPWPASVLQPWQGRIALRAQGRGAGDPVALRLACR